jgi:hypothetical protein
MSNKARLSLSYANVMATVAVFIALGGTTYAATGGNFILGQSNSASSSTQLSSGASGSSLKVTNTGSGRGIAGFSNSGQGIYGHSNSNAGLVGESTSFDGVYGASNGAGAGVSGHNSTSSGWGVFGGAAGGIGVGGYSDTWQGVYGHSNSNAGVVGESELSDGIYGVSKTKDGAAVSAHNDFGGTGVWASGGYTANNTSAIYGRSFSGNAVEGFSSQNQSTAAGVYGHSDITNGIGVRGISPNGTGVVADSSNGWAVQALGHAQQTRARSGFVKAMAWVDPVNNPSDPIQQCFNSQLAANQATSGNCGISFSATAAGQYRLDFGFQVDDRFVNVTTSQTGSVKIMSARSQTATSFNVWGYDVLASGYRDSSFYIVVY